MAGSGAEPAKVRVVGGGEAPSAPWMAAILTHSSAGGSDAQRQFCGGALLGPTVVMTAAHCVRGRSAGTLQVVLGRSDLRSGGGVRHEVAAVLSHPLFSPSGYNNDVALLLLAQPSAQPPLPLARAGDSAADGPWRRATVLGWGSIFEGGPASSKLRSAEISVLPNKACSSPAAYGPDFAKVQMLCAGTPEGGVGSCSGDSGGPLTVDGVAVGIVSWARGCVRPGLPTVYTRLGNESINGWIRAAAESLAAGRVGAPPPRTVVRRISQRASGSASGLRFTAPGEPWAAFQCSSARRRFRACPASARMRTLKRGVLRVRALDVFGATDPTPAVVQVSNRH